MSRRHLRLLVGVVVLFVAAPLAVACSSNSNSPSNNTSKSANAAASNAATAAKRAASAVATSTNQAATAASTSASQAATAAATSSTTSATTSVTSATANNVPESVKSAWATIYSDATGLLNQLQSQNAPNLKQTLLTHCQTAQQQAAQADATLANKVKSLCDQISNTNITDNQAWNQIRQQLNNLNSQIGG